jgi:hypothetical protein
MVWMEADSKPAPFEDREGRATQADFSKGPLAEIHSGIPVGRPLK